MLPVSRSAGCLRLLPPPRTLLRTAHLGITPHELHPYRITTRSRTPSSRRPFTIYASNHSDINHESRSDSNDTFISTDGSPDQLMTLVREEKYLEADQLLSQLLEEGYDLSPSPVYERAIINVLQQPPDRQQQQVFADWLSILPYEKDATPGTFHEMMELLKASPHDRLSLITQLGVVGASKGYMELVEKEVVPLVSRLADPGTLARFISNIYVAAQRHKEKMAQVTRTDSLVGQSIVFEDPSEDYATVKEQSQPLPPTTMDLVENNLPAILPEISPGDPLIFEDESDPDYVVNTVSPPQTTIRSSADALVDLVKRGKDDNYEAAYRMLIELNELNTHIPPSMVYGTPACAALDRLFVNTGSPESLERFHRFYSWLSLLPPRYAAVNGNPLSQITGMVHKLSLATVSMKYALILVGKGYGENIGSIVAFVVRQLPTETSLVFLKEVEAANHNYWETYVEQERGAEKAKAHARLIKISIRGRVVDSLARSGRIDEAVSLLPRPNDDFTLTMSAYNVLIDAIRRTRDPKKIALIPSVESLRDMAEATRMKIRIENADRRKLAVRKTARDKWLVADDDADFLQTYMAKSVKMDQPMDFRGDLAAALRYLKKGIVREQLPHIATISKFMKDCLAEGRTYALTLLLNKALRMNCAGGVNILLLAEMTNYYRRGKYNLVIRTFLDHYYVVGVPREEVLSIYRQIEARNASRASKLGPRVDRHFNETSKRFHESSGIPILTRRKLMPKSTHCTLVWHAIVHHTYMDTRCESLYQKLLKLAEGEQHGSTAVIAPGKHSPYRLIDETIFVPFMRRLMYEYGAPRGIKILQDVVRLGLRPTIYHFTELAGFYARKGDHERAFTVLEKMEANASQQTLSTLSGATVNLHNTPVLDIPSPDFIMYKSIIRGFVQAGDFDNAANAKERFCKAIDYRPRRSRHVDAGLRRIEAYIRQHRGILEDTAA